MSATSISTFSSPNFLQEVELVAKKVAFLSTPSIYFSLGDAAVKKESYVFDVRDSVWLQSEGVVCLSRMDQLFCKLKVPQSSARSKL